MVPARRAADDAARLDERPRRTRSASSSTATRSARAPTHGEEIVDDSFLLLFNAHFEPVEFTLPTRRFGARWELELATGTRSTARSARARRCRCRSTRSCCFAASEASGACCRNDQRRIYHSGRAYTVERSSSTTAPEVEAAGSSIVPQGQRDDEAVAGERGACSTAPSHEIAHITQHLLEDLVTTARAKDREVEAERRGRARADTAPSSRDAGTVSKP